jgi:hypothetical protein
VALSTQGKQTVADNQLAKLNKTQAIEVATRMKNRATAIKRNAEKLSERVVHGVIGTGTGFAMGYWMGSAEAEYQDNIAKLMAEGKTREDAEKEAEDPRKWMGIDKDLVASLGLTALSLSNLAGRKASPFLEAAAFGGLAGWAYSRGMESAISSAEEEEEEDA